MSGGNKPWLDVRAIQGDLTQFFTLRSKDISRFGSTVNQTFEAFLFASVVSHYRARGWAVRIVNPLNPKKKRTDFVLKFSTRGRPDRYSYAECRNGDLTVEIRHQLRVATRSNRDGQTHRANLCLDVAVINAGSAAGLMDADHAPNGDLITFAEAKHMSAYGELLAGFIGMVHELQPQRLKRTKSKSAEHPPPFLFVSGHLLRTALGMLETVEKRKFDISIYHLGDRLPGELTRHMCEARTTPPHPRKAKRRAEGGHKRRKRHANVPLKQPVTGRESAVQTEDDIPF